MKTTVIVIALSFMLVLPSRAQFYSNDQDVIISGVTSNWNGGYAVGKPWIFDTLYILNGGKLFITNGASAIGGGQETEDGPSFDAAIINGTGSVWSTGDLYFGGRGGFGDANDSLTIVNHGAVISSNCEIGDLLGGSNNTVLVTGPGSVWSNSGEIYLGDEATNNSLVISNGGAVFSATGDFGYASSDNSAIVTDAGSIWSNRFDLYVVRLVIRNHGVVVSGNGYVPWGGSVLVTDSGSIWSNSIEIFVGYNGAGNGSLVISNGGAVFAPYGIVDGGSNSVLVTGTGSVLGNLGLQVGIVGDGSSLVIRNGGAMYTGTGYVGYASINNSVQVTDAGSVWSNQFDLSVGYSGVGNSLAISNQGAVVNNNTFLGYNSSSSNNSVLVTGPGSVLSNSLGLFVGCLGAGNNLVVSNRGVMVNGNGEVGAGSSSSNNSVLVTDAGSVWSNRIDLYVGLSGAGNSLVIRHQGAVVNGYGYLGDNSGSNSVLVTDAGSVWSNRIDLYVGSASAGNRLVISNQGHVFNGYGYMGVSFYSIDSSVLVTDSGSVWSNSSDLYIGFAGAGNALVISNQGVVVNKSAFMGYFSSSSSNNSGRVTDGAVWQNDVLHVGEQGSSNSLVVTGGSVFATNLTVGVSSPNCNNVVQLNSGSIFVTNTTGTAVFESRSGTLIQSGGTLKIDVLVVTNACGRFIHTGGALSITITNLDPNLSAVGDPIPNWWKLKYRLDPFDPNLANEDPNGNGCDNLCEYQRGTDPTNIPSSGGFSTSRIGRCLSNCVCLTWNTIPGTTNELQATSCGAGYNTNTFTAIFAVTNATGSVTNYADCGCATNSSSRYYRVRLVP